MNNIVVALCCARAQRHSVQFDSDVKCNRYCSSLAIEWFVAIVCVCVHANGRDEHQKSFKTGRAKAEQTFNFITRRNEQGEEKEDEECKQTINLPLTTQFISLSFRCGCLSAIFSNSLFPFWLFFFSRLPAVAANAIGRIVFICPFSAQLLWLICLYLFFDVVARSLIDLVKKCLRFSN